MSKENFTTDKCWIYIVEQQGKPLSIRISGDLQQQIEYQNFKESKKLIFFRCYSDTLSALGFKLLLQQLSADTIERLIRRANPTRKDLSAEIFIHNTL